MGMPKKPMTLDKAAKLVLEALAIAEADKLKCCEIPIFEAMRILAEHATKHPGPVSSAS
jgi:hypothetical protein